MTTNEMISSATSRIVIAVELNVKIDSNRLVATASLVPATITNIEAIRVMY